MKSDSKVGFTAWLKYLLMSIQPVQVALWYKFTQAVRGDRRAGRGCQSAIAGG